MKVVIFCGGLGMRMRDYAENMPKPMVPIGYRPILWHVMKYYAHFGHKDFILCLGYRADAVKEYFLNYNECLSNDFTLSQGGRDLHLYNSDIRDYGTYFFADTGVEATNLSAKGLWPPQSTWKAKKVSSPTTATVLSDLPLPSTDGPFQTPRCGSEFR